jgi:hypothetical protein
MLEPLLEKVEAYGKSSIALIELKIIDKISMLMAVVFANIIFMLIVVLFFSVVNIGLSIYIGLYLGEIYLGFFLVAAFYAVLGLFFYVFFIKSVLKSFKNRVANLLLK